MDFVCWVLAASERRMSMMLLYFVSNLCLSMAADVELSLLSSPKGFRVIGAATNDNCGWSISKAGDVNGDNTDDIMVALFTLIQLVARMLVSPT